MLQFQEAEHIVLLRQTLERFIEREMPREAAREWDRMNHFPRAVHDKLAALGMMGLTIDEKYGGTGRDITATVTVIEQLCARSVSVGGAYIQSACYAGLNLSELASDAQKAALLPRVAAEGLILAYGISEPDVGADVASVRTTATRTEDTLVVNGNKRFCSGAAICDYIYTLVRTGPTDQRHKNLTLLLIPPNAPGVTLLPQETMGLRGVGTYDVHFNNVEISANQIVGGPSGFNAGWPMLAGPGLDIEKLEISAMALGIARAAVEDAWAYSQERIQFGKPICSIQSIRHMLADVKTRLEACRLMTYRAAWLIDQRVVATVETSMAKLFVCDTAREIVLTCQQIMGAYGYVAGYDMERYVRDILILPILGGSSAIQKNNIANRLNLPR
ncbi:MAG: acyl-CoA dehydrogenase family protein [Pseudomonadota bacterium]